MPKNIFWPEMFFAFTILMFIMVPPRRIIRLLPLGLLAGFGGGVALLSFLVTILGYWGFPYPGVFSIFGFSLWAALAWIPVVVIFSEYLGHPDTRRALYGYIFAFALSTALFVQWLENIGHLILNRWSMWMTFAVALVLYSLTAYAAFRTGVVGERQEVNGK